jgi:hypothetical protein
MAGIGHNKGPPLDEAIEDEPRRGAVRDGDADRLENNRHPRWHPY